jgi:PAS fold
MGQKLTPWAALSRQLPETACGRAIASHDWSRTSMGPPETWPQSLVTLLSTGLACPAPMFMGWGPDLIAFFNDSIPVLGGRADETIGRCTRELLSEVWHELGPMIQAALAGESSLAVDLKFDVQACDIRGKNWWSFTVSPVRDEDGAVAGFVFMSVNTMEGVLARRNRETAAERLQIALAAGDSIGDWDWDVLMNRVTADSRFALIYNVEPDLRRRGPLCALPGTEL